MQWFYRESRVGGEVTPQAFGTRALGSFATAEDRDLGFHLIGDTGGQGEKTSDGNISSLTRLPQGLWKPPPESSHLLRMGPQGQEGLRRVGGSSQLCTLEEETPPPSRARSQEEASPGCADRVACNTPARAGA